MPPEEPLLLTLNGRSDAWALAVDGWESLVTGNGVGARGTGSTRTSIEVSGPPRFDGAAPEASFAGDPAFLDSSYAQVQSDVGIVGSAALLTALAGTAAFLVRRLRADPSDGAAWAATGVLLVSVVDWIDRSSLASYTTASSPCTCSACCSAPCGPTRRRDRIRRAACPTPADGQGSWMREHSLDARSL